MQSWESARPREGKPGRGFPGSHGPKSKYGRQRLRKDEQAMHRDWCKDASRYGRCIGDCSGGRMWWSGFHQMIVDDASSGLPITMFGHRIGNDSKRGGTGSISAPHLLFLKTYLLSRPCLAGPCDPENPRLAPTSSRAGGLRGSHGPGNDCDGWRLRKGEELAAKADAGRLGCLER